MEGQIKRKEKLQELINRYKALMQNTNEDISEEMIRVWLNEFLEIFGWNVQNPMQISQEITLSKEEKEKLKQIGSTHERPDYTLKNGRVTKSFLDAKNTGVDIFEDTEGAFQIRSYGWSAGIPAAFVSNFEKLVIYDTRFTPDPNQGADIGTIQLEMDEYIDQFELLDSHLNRENIWKNKLEELYATMPFQGSHPLDEHFSSILENFRTKLGKRLAQESDLDEQSLNYLVQVILNRILFIRVCESRGLEKEELLKNLAEGNFWQEFTKKSEAEFYSHYDGVLFHPQPLFSKLDLENVVFKDFIESLYYPYPYRFDVIPLSAIAGIYETFLGKRLVLKNGKIKEEIKGEYLKTNGAVATPSYLAELLCRQTLNLEEVDTADELFSLRIFDPCCGSGIFLITAYDLLEERLKKIIAKDPDRYKELYILQDDKIVLSVNARKKVIENCLYGMDLDENAIEVCRLSLALKVIDAPNVQSLVEAGYFGSDLLKGIDRNIRLGNTLVWPAEGFDSINLRAVQIQKIYREVFENGGFDYILSNPPYVETKYFKKNAAYHAFLSEKYAVYDGKADLSILFISRCLQLLKEKGRLGFLIQRRWFKTDYGKKIREFITNHGYLKELIDFQTTDLFKGRITYISAMILEKSFHDKVDYLYEPKSPALIQADVETKISPILKPMNRTSGDTTWAYDWADVIDIRDQLAKKFPAIGQIREIEFKGGIQVLWKNAYHIRNYQVKDGIVSGETKLGEIKVEKEMARAVAYNDGLYPFCEVVPDAYTIFPYHQDLTPVPIDEIEKEYPLLFEYLHTHEKTIKEKVKTNPGNIWPKFTRDQNHAYYDTDKIIMPMTAKDTTATLVTDKGIYMDNSNMWFLCMDGESREMLKALCALFNSTVFSVLGKAGANVQSGGYFKFNKQYITPIPLPLENLRANINELNQLSDHIKDLQNKYLRTYNPGSKNFIRAELENAWQNLDELSMRIYELTDDQRKVILERGRSQSRIDVLEGKE